MQPIVMMYEDIRAEMVRKLMAFRATVDPMFIRERAMVIARETKTALSGMFQPGAT